MSTSSQQPTQAQRDACAANRLEVGRGRFFGELLAVPYWGAPDHWALVNTHGSISYYPPAMLAAALGPEAAAELHPSAG